MVVDKKYLGFLVLVIISFAGFELFSNFYLLTSLGMALVIFIFVKFYFDMGKRVEIRDVIVLMATLQWILGPVMAYHIFEEHPLFYMAVDEKQYMNFVVPACYALVIGLYLPLSSNRIVGEIQFDRIRDFVKDQPKLAYILIGMGLFFSAIRKFMPGSLEFFFFLLGNMQFVGLFLLMLTPKAKFKWLLFGIVMSLLLSNAMLQGMFHQLLLWLIFLFLIMALIFRFSILTKSLFFLVGIILVTLIQSIKDDYREETWYKTELTNSKENIFRDVFMDRINNPSAIFEGEMMNNMNTRLNQGWIIARILNHVPGNEPFAEGETVKKAVEASLLPRILIPNKVMAGGKENFERFTGTYINDKTSMDLSIAGEAYANFGTSGGILFMFIIGIFYNLVLIRILKISIKHPVLILWIPLLFFQVIKAETDFSTVLNHLIKSAIVVTLVFWSFKNFFGIKL